MKARVLLVCYYFPPLGLAGVGRPLHLFKHLPEYGYDCHVLTVKGVAYRKYEPELLEGLDQKKIFRSGSRDPQRLMYLLGIREVNARTIERGAKAGESLFPDAKVGWVRPAVKLGLELHDRFQYKAVITTSPPISSHVIGLRLMQEAKVKWVADFRDLWTLHGIKDSYASDKLRGKAEQLKRKIVSEASGLVTVNPAIAEYLGRGDVITNGFDTATANLWEAPSGAGKFVIGLLGTLNEKFALEPLLQVLQAWLQKNPGVREKLRIVQVGQVDKDWLRRLVERYGLDGLCHSYGVKPREETVRLLSETSLLYVGLASGLEAVVPARTFDLLASGRPILAYTPKSGEMAKLLVVAKEVCFFDDAADAAAASFVHDTYRCHTEGRLKIVPRPQAVQQYGWQSVVKRYAEYLDRVI